MCEVLHMRGLVSMAIELHDDQGAFSWAEEEGVPGHGCIAAVLPLKYKYSYSTYCISYEYFNIVRASQTLPLEAALEPFKFKEMDFYSEQALRRDSKRGLR